MTFFDLYILVMKPFILFCAAAAVLDWIADKLF